MKGFIGNIEDLTKKNTAFRRVLYTGQHLQLVLMSIEPGDEIGSEVHVDRDQFFRVESGQGEVWIDGEKSRVEQNYAVVVPAKAKHNFVNTGSKPLRLYTIYGPPEHNYRTLKETRALAMTSEEHFDGKTNE